MRVIKKKRAVLIQDFGPNESKSLTTVTYQKCTFQASLP